MVVAIDGVIHYGAGAARKLAEIGRPATPARRFLLWFVGRAPWASALYPCSRRAAMAPARPPRSRAPSGLSACLPACGVAPKADQESAERVRNPRRAHAHAGRNCRGRARRADAFASSPSRWHRVRRILESRSRDYIESRIRAGLIEQWASDLLVETGVGARMQREGMFHNGVHFGFGGATALHQFPRPGRQGRDGLRPAGGGERPDRSAAGRRRTDPVRSGGRQRARLCGRRQAENSTSVTMARTRNSPAISSAAATAFTASAGRAFRHGAHCL